MKVAVIGATGMVGEVMLQVLEKRQFRISELLVAASERSVGKSIQFKGAAIAVQSLSEVLRRKPQIALFSAGADTSREWAPRFAEAGTTVIDNSSAWRMKPNIPLIVPEVNSQVLTSADRIIANPNCSTIQMVVALWPLHQEYGIDRIVISTYQSMTGTGIKAVEQYEREKQGGHYEGAQAAYPHPIYANCIPHCDVFTENDYTKEEMKLVHETRKIMRTPDLRITATAVRVPVIGGHSESVNVSFRKPYALSDIRNILSNAPGIVLRDQVSKNIYPMPYDAHQKDEVFVGRIRRDSSIENGLNLWIVADNLRKGAATNTIQIAEYLHQKGWVRD